MAKWYLNTKKADFNQIAKDYDISPFLARIIRNRDVIGDEATRKYLYGGQKDFYSPHLLKDMEKAVDILEEKIAAGSPIRIIGDYDADGICAAYILWRGLCACGALADTLIPHRIKDGYGLSSTLIRETFEEGIDTIVTCDNGIAAAVQVEEAVSCGMTVIVTDHHEVPFETAKDGSKQYLLPNASAVIDPKRPDCGYPFSGICGGVVAFKLTAALFEKLHPAGGEEILQELLEIAAFSTICDVMELRDENRLIVKCGLKNMRKTRNIGLKALIQVCDLEPESLSAYHIGFILGPCINATGRLDTAVRALSLFKSENMAQAAQIAAELKNLNESRKQMTLDWTQKAVHAISEQGYEGDKVLVVYLPQCHESLAGIIAGRIREKYGRPVFVLTDAETGVKGSGRSVDAYHMYEEMSVCKDLFTRYGGHKMAAGFSMEQGKVEELRERMNKACMLTQEDFEEKITIDIALPFPYLSHEFLEELAMLEPFGMGNPKPVFAQKNITLLSGSILGKNKNVGKYQVRDEAGGCYEMMYFGDLSAFDLFLNMKAGEKAAWLLYEEKKAQIPINITYQASLNHYGGRSKVQIVMQNYQ